MTAVAQLNSALAGRYHVEREIGQGGMAMVYLAQDLRHQRRVALKVLSPELGAVLGVERFLAEIRVTANLQHPNLLPLFDSGEADGLLFYVMPFVDGESLRARLEREKQLPIDEAIRIATAVASALDYAHRHNVIHRDLKPENILLHEGQPLVADFGIALAVSNAGGQRVTQTGLSLGTPQYMSPEQATGDRGIDARTDIYSLGAVTYEMLAGEPPHAGPTAQAIIAKLMTEEPRSLTVVRRTVPAYIDEAVRCALEKLPADRFATAHAFAEALANPAATRPRVRARGTTTHRGTLLERLALPIAGVALVATALAAWALVRLAREPVRPVVRNILTLDGGAVTAAFAGFDLAPDGSRVVYSSGPRWQLFLRDRSQLQSVPLPGTEGAQSPVFSIDGERIAFFADNALRVTSTRGGLPVTITDSLVGRAGFAWGPDGYLYIDGSGSVPLARVRPQPGAKPAWFTTLDSSSGEIDHLWPDVLPNGKGVLFTIAYRNKGLAGAAIGVADPTTGKHTVLLNGMRPRYSTSGHILYVTANGTLMMIPFDQRSLAIRGQPTAVADGLRLGAYMGHMTVSRSGSLLYMTGTRFPQRELVWMNRNGTAAPVDAGWHGTFSDPALSPDGKRLAVAIANDVTRASEVWTKDLDTGPAVKFTVDGGGRFPSWTPDGQSISYASSGAKGFRLWTKRADGSGAAIQMLNADREFVDPRWSADGKWLVFRTPGVGPRSGDILGVRVGVDSTPIPLVAGSFQESEHALSPDGRWLAYTSLESGRSQVYVVPFPNTTAAKWIVSTDGGASPAWSHRGRELFYLDDGGNLISVQVKTDPTFSMGPATTLFPWPAATSLVQTQGTFIGAGRRQFDVGPDDQRFLMLRSVGGSEADRLVMVDNWFAELRAKEKRTP